MRATAACSSPAYQEVVSMTRTTSIPRFTVNWCTGPTGSPAGSEGAGTGSSAMPTETATPVPPRRAFRDEIILCMRVFVTGGAGYIGSVVAEVLLARGHAVSVYDDLSGGHRDAVPDGARLLEGDLLDRARLDAALREARPEAVVHMAALCQVGESMVNPAAYYRVNLLGGLTLLDAMRAAGMTRLVFSSTAAVYGEPAKQPIQEDDPTAPSNPYGETKLALERALPPGRRGGPAARGGGSPTGGGGCPAARPPPRGAGGAPVPPPRWWPAPRASAARSAGVRATRRSTTSSAPRGPG